MSGAEGPSEVSTLTVDQALQQAIVHHAAGRLAEAERLYRRILEAAPLHADAHHNLGVLALQVGRPDVATPHLKNALEAKPEEAQRWTLYLEALIQIEWFDAAQAVLVQARQGGFGGPALDPFQMRLAAKPAEQEVLALNQLFARGAYAEAATLARSMVEIAPAGGFGWRALGLALGQLGRLEEAEDCYLRSLQFSPAFARARVDLAWIFIRQGKFLEALPHVRRVLETVDAPLARGAFVACVRRLKWMERDAWIEGVLVQALTEPWGRPNELIQCSVDMILLDPAIRACVERAGAAFPQPLPGAELFGPDGLAALARHPLVSALLTSTASCGLEMERFLTAARRALLGSAIASTPTQEDALAFFGVLARQCFINEYVFDQAPEEAAMASDIAERLAAGVVAGSVVAPLTLLAAAAYFPLHKLPAAELLLAEAWPEPCQAVLRQQVLEPLEQLRLRDAIPRLTEIDDAGSTMIRQQYEENPYPRWIRLAAAAEPMELDEYFSGKFPGVAFDRRGTLDLVDMLVAGCGTGQHPLQSLLQFKRARMLAVDLSLSSLSYAKRKSLELGVTAVDYAQADILRLNELGRRFDIVESIGVLHHLADPESGWPILLSLLKPGGFMKVGLYSAIARRRLGKVKELIDRRGYRGDNLEDIRKCRQEIMASAWDPDFAHFLTLVDFYSASECCDLLFHVQEHCTSLDRIDAFLKENDLRFMGFETDPHLVHAYRRRFPNDPTATDLAQWEVFEAENPDSFIGMYMFWIQKKDVDATGSP